MFVHVFLSFRNKQIYVQPQTEEQIQKEAKKHLLDFQFGIGAVQFTLADLVKQTKKTKNKKRLNNC